MKTIIICEDSEISSKIDSFLQNKQINTIIYKWFIKAIDNLEEINPDSIIISALEYPRHWKTLVSFLNSKLFHKKARIYLYYPDSLSEEEQKKFDFLKIDGQIHSLSDKELSILINNDVSNEKFESEDEEEILPTIDDIFEDNEQVNVSGTGKFICNHPINHALLTGNFFDFNDKKMTINLDYENQISKLPKNTIIKDFTYYYKEKCINCKMKIVDSICINDNNLVILELA